MSLENNTTKEGGGERRVSFHAAKEKKNVTSATTVSKPKGRINVSAKARLDEGTTFAALAKFPLLFFQWPYAGGVLFLAFILMTNVFLGDRCDAGNYHELTPAVDNGKSVLGDPSGDVISTWWPNIQGTLICANVQLGDLCDVGNDNSFAGMQSDMQDVLICGKPTKDFSLDGTERIIMWLLAAAGVLGDVIPKYLGGGVAQRHLGQRTANRALIFHIMAGVVSVLGNGLVGILWGGGLSGFALKFFMANDLFHQLSILLLTKNHDGTYALRPGNLAFAVIKFVALINHSRHGHDGSIFDLWFVASFGFLGTRLASILVILTTYLKNQDRRNEDWYSIGTFCMHLYLAVRVPGAERLFFYVTPISAFLFYHELWDKSKKPQFVAWNVAYSVVCLMFLSSPCAFYVAIIAYYYVAGFGFYKKRFYRWPKNAFKGESEKKMSEVDLRRSMVRKNSTWKTSFR